MPSTLKIKKETKNSFIALKKPDQYIFCFGSKHVFDPKHKQFSTIEGMWGMYTNLTKKKARIAFIEGGKRPFFRERDEAIIEDGEAGFVTWLAKKTGIPIRSPEPPGSFERKELQKKFSKESIELYYFVRMVYQWNLYTKKPDFEKYIRSFLQKESQESHWQDFDFSLAHLKKIHKKLIGKPFDKDDTSFQYRIINPTYRKNLTIVNKVSKESGRIRDEYIVKKLLSTWKKGRSIFVVYGSGHLPILKNAFVQQ